MVKDIINEDVKNLIEYCKYLEWNNLKTKGFDRGYRFGIEHIRQQIEKILNNEWTKWEIDNFPEYKQSLKRRR